MDEMATPTPVDSESKMTATVDLVPNAAPVVETEAKASTLAAKAPSPSNPRTKKTVKPDRFKPLTKRKKHAKRRISSSDEESTSSSSSDESEESTSPSESEIEDKKRKAKKKKAKAKDDDTIAASSDDSSSSSDEKDERAVAKAKTAKKLRKLRAQIKALRANDDLGSDTYSDSSEAEEARKPKLKEKRKAKKAKRNAARDALDASHDPTRNPNQRRTTLQKTGLYVIPKPSSKQAKRDAKAAQRAEAKRKKLKGTKMEFVRVDRLWDYDRHAYITRETRADTESGEYDEFVFNVRRMFNWDNKHISTVVDIKSKPLKEALIKIMGIVKGISLAEDTPSIDPNIIFLYLEELRTYMKELKVKAKAEKRKKKVAKAIKIKCNALKVLIKYLDKDYDETKKTLYPMLETGTITFDLLWALFKSNEIVYAPTYGTEEVPRAFKVEYSTLVSCQESELCVCDFIDSFPVAKITYQRRILRGRGQVPGLQRRHLR